MLRSHGAQGESSLEFGVARRLFDNIDRSVLADAPAAGRNALSAESEHGAPDDILAACYGLFWICSEMADAGPLVLLVDDAHWTDDATIRFLGYVLERIGPTAIGIAVATPSGSERRWVGRNGPRP